MHESSETKFVLGFSDNNIGTEADFCHQNYVQQIISMSTSSNIIPIGSEGHPSSAHP